MAMQADDRMYEEAIGWHLRLQDTASEAGPDVWDTFVDWLEADPRHNIAYEAIADADLALEPAIALARSDISVPDHDDHDVAVLVEDEAHHTAPPRRRWALPALAASVAVALTGAWMIEARSGNDYTIRTAAGETRAFALGDGTRIMLNGSTEIALNRSDPRRAELLSGEAQFTVHHDAVHPFSLTVGDRTLVDVGTVFDVRTAGSAMQVEVAEGAVRYEEGVTRVRLDAGDTLSARDDGLITGRRPVGEIGGWTRGRLVYRNRPLIDVAADITRSRGVAIELAPELAAQTFTGVIQLDGDDAALQKRLESLLGLKVTSTADGWTIAK